MHRVSSSRCALHDLACGPDGQCALCHRKAGTPTSLADVDRTSKVVLGAIGGLALLVAAGFTIQGIRGTVKLMSDPAAAQAAVDADAPTNPVRLYTTSWCPHCSKAKAWLRAQHVEYAELDVEHDAWAHREHRRLNPRGSVPTFDAYGEVVQGFSPEGFQAALQRGAAKQEPRGSAAP
jgi:glutaredoxin